MREKVKRLSSAGTGHFYVATKNKRLHPDKMTMKKMIRRTQHVDYKESKIKKISRPGARNESTDDKGRQPQRAFFIADRTLTTSIGSTIAGSGGWQSAGGL